MDYKFTINLPFTNFSMKANLIKKERFIADFWNKIKIYEKQKNRIKKFILNDGPPYANGQIHIGHAFNKILKDIIIKFKILENYEICFIPGWDCHGLPIELNVEKKTLNLKLFSNNFRELCKKYAEDQIEIQKNSFLKLGIIADWENFYTTMNKFFELSVINSLKDMFKKGFIYNGSKPVYWCFNCLSALAEAEVEYDFRQSKSIYFNFAFINGNFLNFIKFEYNLTNIYFVIWTTTPWTVPFNEAVALNFNNLYILIELDNVGYIIGSNTYLEICKKIGFKKYNILLFFNGNVINDTLLNHPIYKKKIRIVYSEHVKVDSGTGCVHIAPSYGYDDYKIALKYKLPIFNSIDDNGYSYKNVFKFEELHINNINFLVLKILNKNKKLLFIEEIKHRYPYCWRHKTQLIFRTTNQWFFNINKLYFKKKILDIVSNNIKWIPESGKTKMISMLNDRPDWCISRQRFWGIPLFFFIDDNGNVHPETEKIMDKIILLIKNDGCNFWYNSDVFNILNIDKKIYKKTTDVLDVWFDSSVVYKYISDFYKINLPFDLCVEGSDQYRGWFQVSLINSIANYNINPYKTILAHGFILDKFGRKMSKSLNNVISPNDVISKYGVDILRLWISSVNYHCDINLSDEILERVSEAYRKIRNTFRFLLSNLYDLEIINLFFKNFNLLKLDIWIISKFCLLNKDIILDYSNYKFCQVYKKIYKFFIEDLGCKYFDLIKDRLYIALYDSIYRKSAQFVLFYLIFNLVKLIAPILSFTAEEIWTYIPLINKKSVFLSNFQSKIFLKKKITFNIKNAIFWDKMFCLKNNLNKIFENFRNDQKMGSTLDIEMEIFCNAFWYNFLKFIKKELHFFFIVSKAKLNFFKKSKFKNDNFLNGISIKLIKSKLEKCDRCWNRYHNYNYLLNLKICNRCIFNLYYIEQERTFI